MFKLPVPRNLQGIVGRTIICKTLETRDLVEAREKRNVLAEEWLARFEEIRRELGIPRRGRGRPASTDHCPLCRRPYAEPKDF